MARLEQLTPGASVRGLLAAAAARIVQVEWFGDQAVKVTFAGPDGTVRNRLVYRSDEASLELVGSGRAWSFQGDGYPFGVAFEAQQLAYLFEYAVRRIKVPSGCLKRLKFDGDPGREAPQDQHVVLLNWEEDRVALGTHRTGD